MATSRDNSLRWKVLDRGQAQDFGIFRTRRQLAAHPSVEAPQRFSVIESEDFVNIIALTESDRVVLVRQFRHGTESVTLEIPGGIVDPGETHGAAAERELREETGYDAQTWIKLGDVLPNPAIMNNHCSTWLALDARRVDTPSPDGTEVIETEEVPLAEIADKIAEGTIQHALVLAGFAHLLVRTNGAWSRPRLSRLTIEPND